MSDFLHLENTLIVLFPLVYIITSIVNAISFWAHYKTIGYQLYKIIPNVISNITVVTPITIKLVFMIKPICVFHKGFFIELLEFFINIVILEISFHNFHRLFHLPVFYTYHKLHHSIKEVIGVAALYCHWSEMVFVNLSGFIFSHILFSHSFLHLFATMTLAIINTICASHSISTSQHSIHHLKFNVNYGIFNILDYFCGTKSK